MNLLFLMNFKVLIFIEIFEKKITYIIVNFSELSVQRGKTRANDQIRWFDVKFKLGFEDLKILVLLLKKN